MDKDKSLPLPPPSSRYFKPSDSATFSHDISGMPEIPPKNRGHRRAHSEILTLPDDISFDGVVGVAGDDVDEDLLSLYLHIDNLNSSSMPDPSPPDNDNNVGNERPRVRHQHSHSMDGSIQPEMLVSAAEDVSGIDSRKAMSAAKLAELASIDPKRAKRIWANRQSAARSKERKMRYISELERKVQTLQTEATSLSAQLTLLQRDTNGLTAENSELKLRLQTMEQQVHLQDALNDALKDEIQHLKVLTGQVMSNGGGTMNFTSFGGGQQFYPNNQAMHTLLAAQQFQQLQIHSQKQQQQQQFQQLQQQQFHQQQLQQQQQQQKQQQKQQQQQQQQTAATGTPAFMEDRTISDECWEINSIDNGAECMEEVEVDELDVINMNGDFEPCKPASGMSFPSQESVKSFCRPYASRMGFGFIVRNSKKGRDGKLHYFILTCSREGTRVPNTLKTLPTIKNNCEARITVSLKDGLWYIMKAVLDHSHELSPMKAMMLLNKGGDEQDQSLACDVGGYRHLPFVEQGVRNHVQKGRRTIGKEGDGKALMSYFLRMQEQNCNFFYDIDLDDFFRVKNVFWADARSRATYNSFGDVVTFDTTYLTKKYDMSFVSFVSVNHHGQYVLLGCGLLSSEDTESFMWLFASWLRCMSGNPPKAIVTDQCKAIQNAIQLVFPTTRHR
ncbi:putative transcription factor PosF21, partial [Mucuna pruriens]